MRDVDLEAEYVRRCARVGEFLTGLGRGMGAQGIEGGVVTRVNIRLPTDDQPDTLLVVKVSGDAGAFIGFVGGLDIGTAVLAWRAKDGAAGLKWRVDVPWAERQAK